ncbi:MAG: TSUP family transporter [Actinomycetia bacterium]|nr:TSUP family transporter [Actinomycetes bacterium]
MSFSWPKAAIVGIVAGFLSGLLGIGGGVIVVPGLVLLVGLNQHKAAATSVATIVFTASAALLAFATDGAVDWSTALIVFAGAATGAWAGAHYMHKIPEYALAGVFTLVLATSSIRMFL